MLMTYDNLKKKREKKEEGEEEVWIQMGGGMGSSGFVLYLKM